MERPFFAIHHSFASYPTFASAPTGADAAMATSETTQLDPASAAWAPYTPSDAAPWNLQRVVHLHRRAALGAPWQTIQRDLQAGPAQAIDSLLAGAANSADLQPFENLARTIGDAATASGNAGRLKAWWLYRMLASPDPLAERLTLVWHNHFATSNRKVQDLPKMREQNDILRSHAHGPFAELLQAVVKHPAMLLWLDADANRKGHANENLARELLELFTLGIGAYSENDVQESARALTGWGIFEGKFGYQPLRHDDGEIQILGQRGKFDGDGLLQLLLEHPATPRRLAWRVTSALMGENFAKDAQYDARINELATGLRERNLDIGWAVETVLRSQAFFASDNIKSRVSGPIDFAIGALNVLELNSAPPSTLLLADWTGRMGQELFYPPNVGGWREGRAWLSSRTIIARANFAAALVAGRLWNPAQPQSFAPLCERHGVATDLESAVPWFATLLWGTASPPLVKDIVSAAGSAPEPERLGTAIALLLACPEHQLS